MPRYVALSFDELLDFRDARGSCTVPGSALFASHLLSHSHAPGKASDNSKQLASAARMPKDSYDSATVWHECR